MNGVIIYFSPISQELDQHARLYRMKEEDLRHRQDLERKRLPKIQRNEMRTKSQAKRKQLRSERNKRESIVGGGLGGLNSSEKDKLREVKFLTEILFSKEC